jgi:hypothetical protein
MIASLFDRRLLKLSEGRGNLWRRSKIRHRCDTQTRCQSGDHKKGRRRVF